MKANTLDQYWTKVALWLIITTILYNTIEGVVSVWAGIHAKSIALECFGIDSIIEVSAAGLFLWALLKQFGGACECDVEERERFVRRFIGGTFIALATYVVIQSGIDLGLHQTPNKV